MHTIIRYSTDRTIWLEILMVAMSKHGGSFMRTQCTRLVVAAAGTGGSLDCSTHLSMFIASLLRTVRSVCELSIIFW